LAHVFPFLITRGDTVPPWLVACLASRRWFYFDHINCYCKPCCHRWRSYKNQLPVLHTRTNLAFANPREGGKNQWDASRRQR